MVGVTVVGSCRKEGRGEMRGWPGQAQRTKVGTGMPFSAIRGTRRSMGRMGHRSRDDFAKNTDGKPRVGVGDVGFKRRMEW